MRIHIEPGNIRRFQRAFYEDTCLECHQTIDEGDPIGYVDGEGPMCDDCIKDCGTRTKIEIREE